MLVKPGSIKPNETRTLELTPILNNGIGPFKHVVTLEHNMVAKDPINSFIH
jgi:hypothetical protein